MPDGRVQVLRPGPTGPQQLISAFAQQYGATQERQLKERELKLKEQEMPVKNLIQIGTLAKSLHELGLDPRIILGTKAVKDQFLQPTEAPAQVTAPTGAPPTGMPTIPPSVTDQLPQLRPTAFETTPLGGIRPTKFEPIETQEELDREAEQAGRAAGIKQQVLDKLKGMPGESAAKLTMIQQALSDLEGVEKQLFTPEGKFRRGLAFAANIPGGQAFGIGRLIPDVGFGTGPRILNSRMNNALEAKLRIETGAAATQEEFNRLQTRFGVTGFDTPESARNKIKRLKEFMRSAIITIDPTGRFTYKTGDTRLDKELSLPSPQSLGLDPNRFEVIGD